MEEPETLPQILRRTGDSNSPEFEFWMVRNPSFPQPNLLSADELFSDGVMLPLHLLHISDNPPPPTENPEPSGSDRVPDPESSADLTATPALTSSKRWRDIFKKTDKKSSEVSSDNNTNNVKERRREKKNGGLGVSTAELNINIWPFSRSRSAGNGGNRPRAAAPPRKVSSAPCSRSNSAGESKSRKWPSSPGRGGVHIGRSSPVWQARRSVGGDKGARKDGSESRRKIPTAASGGFGGSKARVLNLNVPMCIGYRNHLSCRSDVNSAGSIAGDGEGVRGSNLFNIRSLFTKKVY